MSTTFVRSVVSELQKSLGSVSSLRAAWCVEAACTVAWSPMSSETVQGVFNVSPFQNAGGVLGVRNLFAARSAAKAWRVKA